MKTPPVVLLGGDFFAEQVAFYNIIIELTTTQFWNYQQRFKDYLDGKISLAERVTDSDKQSFETIEKNVEALNNELREHLQKIYIVT